MFLWQLIGNAAYSNALPEDEDATIKELRRSIEETLQLYKPMSSVCSSIMKTRTLAEHA